MEALSGQSRLSCDSAKHYYSVPHNFLRGKEVEARITVKTVEIFLRGKRVASHLRSTLPHRPTTVAEHMPSSHRRYRDWTHERIRRDAAKVGPDADTLIDVILRSRPHPEQGFRSAIGIFGLVKRYGPERARRRLRPCPVAQRPLLQIRFRCHPKNGTDKTAAPTPEAPILFHSNIRGRGYQIDQEITMLIHPTVERLRSSASLPWPNSASSNCRTILRQPRCRTPIGSACSSIGKATFRDNRRLSRRLTAGQAPSQAATIENIDYRTSRGLDRALFQTLATSQWVRDRNHLAIVGPTGTGKSWLACALGNKACRDGFSVLYKRAPRLFADLASRGEGRLSRLMTTLERTNLIIIDDWGPEPLTADQRRDLLEIVDDRYDKGSLLITSQVPVSQWHDVIANPTLGDAILDRIIHNAHRIGLKGDSLRRRAGEKKAGMNHLARFSRRPDHTPLPRAPLRRSWGHSAPRAGPCHRPLNDLNPPANLDQETISSTPYNRQSSSLPHRRSARQIPMLSLITIPWKP